ncbi:MAG: hypothetical protein EA381_16925 [Planctomycetaceae bacterium]|nr:MAG: hypothetical protein EA381_16925 [Planctomycetaceae bacterium]
MPRSTFQLKNSPSVTRQQSPECPPNSKYGGTEGSRLTIISASNAASNRIAIMMIKDQCDRAATA